MVLGTTGHVSTGGLLAARQQLVRNAPLKILKPEIDRLAARIGELGQPEPQIAGAASRE